ncbi:MAG TPA: phytoene desaturase family protein [Bacteroidia bacterium]|nr:phytoene desaturase family protein [Bacteroidia bacterium]
MSSHAKTCAIIGCGISGIGASIRMANKGYKVTVFEANAFPGGKLSQETIKGYRFDMGPSVFTMPQNVDELFTLSGKNPKDYFNYIHLDPVYQYFFEDGTIIQGYHTKEKIAKEIAAKTKVKEQAVIDYLTDVEQKYHLTADVFLHNSLHKVKNYFTKRVAKGIANFGKLQAFKTMHQANAAKFVDPKVVQIFNRYATYNGSSPYMAPATLNVIPHLEINMGAFIPVGGMFAITDSLVKLGNDIGVKYRFSSPVKEIVIENNKATGVRTDAGVEKFDVVISNMDVYNTYHKLIPNAKKPERTLRQEKSSSAMVFYWGIKHEFKQLGLHNILFSDNYEKEFSTIFNDKTIYEDPTIYVNISSKHVPEDAPPGCENWFTMINVPNNQGQDWDKLIETTRENIIKKVNRILKTDIRQYIECEIVFEPRVIEARTSSAFGAVYGNASNNKFAAFLRHANFSKDIANLYFCGGSVHPGPSIPLSLMSAKIATSFIK